LDCDVLIKATKVDGVYDADPAKNSQARKFEDLTYDEIISRRLEVMDATAVTLCRDNNLPILVLNLWDEDALMRALRGERTGTLIHS